MEEVGAMSFPYGSRGQGSAMVLLVDEETGILRLLVFFSKMEAAALANEMGRGGMMIAQEAARSSLPEEDSHPTMVLDGYVGHLLGCMFMQGGGLAHEGAPTVPHPTITMIMALDAPFAAALERLLGTHPKPLILLGLNESATPEVKIAWSRWQAAALITERRAWAEDQDQLEQWETAVATSDLPEHSEHTVVSLPFGAAGVLVASCLLIAKDHVRERNTA